MGRVKFIHRILQIKQVLKRLLERKQKMDFRKVYCENQSLMELA
jgi:hypothetical protein